jgi:hypothetical protein
MGGMTHKLRIAFSVASGVVCLLSIALWVRSYGYHDIVEKRASSWLLRGHSVQGLLCFSQVDPSRDPEYKTAREVSEALDDLAYPRPFLSLEINDSHPEISFGGFFGFEYRDETNISRGVYDISRAVYIPYWCPVFLSGVFAATPWIKWSRRFSLRTLLIATTLTAVLLGAIVNAIR